MANDVQYMKNKNGELVMKITLHSMTQLEAFVNYCGNFDGDVDASDGSITVDAKLYRSVVRIGLDKEFEVTINNEDNDMIRDIFYSRLKALLEMV